MFGKKKKGGGAAKPAKKTKAKKAKKGKQSTAGQSRFGEGGLKAAVVGNFEKVLLGIVALSALGIALKSYQRPGLADSNQPTQLASAISSADSHLKVNTWSAEAPNRVSIPDNYEVQASGDTTAVNPVRYAMSQPFEPIKFSEPKRRSDVELLALLDLEVVTGHAVAMSPPKETRRSTPRIGEDEDTISIDLDLEKGIREIPEEVAGRLSKFLQPQEGGKLTETYFACVTGLISIKDQYEKYRETYADANGFNLERDYPNFIQKFQVERAEILRNGKLTNWSMIWGAEADKRTATEKTLRSRTIDFCVTSRGMIEEVARIDALSRVNYPLPAFVYRDMSTYKHSTIATQMEVELASMDEADQQQDDAVVDPLDSTNPDGLGGGDGGYGGYGGRGGGGYGGYGGGGGGGYGGYGGGGGGGDGGYGGYGGGGGGYGSGGYGGGEGGGYSGGAMSGNIPVDEMGNYMAAIDHKMFRFFDFTVKPGRSYRYRVRLALEDPNNPRMVPMAPRPQHLTPEVTQRLREHMKANSDPKNRVYWRYADWSESSPIASVGRSERIIAGTVKAATLGRSKVKGKNLSYPKVTNEPEIESIVIGFERESSVDIPGKEKLRRGAMANFVKKKVEHIDPKIRMLRTKERHVFQSNILVLDINGGAEMTGRKGEAKLRTPGEMLVFTASGQLEVHSEIDESREYYYNDYPKPEPGSEGYGGGYGEEDDGKKKKRGRRGGGGYGGY